jgi:hypothetical protein
MTRFLRDYAERDKTAGLSDTRQSVIVTYPQEDENTESETDIELDSIKPKTVREKDIPSEKLTHLKYSNWDNRFIVNVSEKTHQNLRQL